MLRVGELGKTLQIDRRPHGDVLVVDRLPVDVTIGAAHVLHAQKKAERHDGRCRDPAQAQEPPLPAGSMPEGLHPLGQAFPGKSCLLYTSRGKADGTIFAATDEIQNRNAMERIVEFPTDRTVISTENNGFAGDERDETLIDENLVETEIPLADRIPGAVRETEEGDRPIYDEEGYRNDPGGE